MLLSYFVFIWLWISNFLKQRKRVVVDGIQSDLVIVDSGVPQGTVLGPVLFLLFFIRKILLRKPAKH